MLKGLKGKKEGKGDPKKDVKKEVEMCLFRNNPKRKERSKCRRRKRKLMMPLSRSISNFNTIQ